MGKYNVANLRVGLALLTAVVPGCSFLVSPTQPVRIAASDPRAEIIVDGNSVGVGSAAVDLRRDRGHAVMARTADGRSATAMVRSRISGVGILDIVLGALDAVNLFGMMAPGFHELDTEGVALSLPVQSQIGIGVSESVPPVSR
jgi:hypothetical protein